MVLSHLNILCVGFEHIYGVAFEHMVLPDQEHIMCPARAIEARTVARRTVIYTPGFPGAKTAALFAAPREPRCVSKCSPSHWSCLDRASRTHE